MGTAKHRHDIGLVAIKGESEGSFGSESHHGPVIGLPLISPVPSGANVGGSVGLNLEFDLASAVLECVVVGGSRNVNGVVARVVVVPVLALIGHAAGVPSVSGQVDRLGDG